MTRSKISAAVFAAAAFVSVAAFPAQAAQTLNDNEAVYVTRSGEVTAHRINNIGHNVMMKEARALPAGAVIYRDSGRLYLLEDRRLSSGKMMFDSMAAWFDRAVGSRW